MHKVIILAHGSRDSLWKIPLENINEMLKNEFGENNFDVAYLEFISPDIKEIVFKSYKNGFRSFSFLPLFIAAGAHLRNDVPKIIADICTELTDIDYKILAPIGEHELFRKAILEIVRGYQDDF